MTKANYLALADVQSLWDDKMKPYIGEMLDTKAAASHTHTKAQITDYESPDISTAFVDETLVFYSGGAFVDETLVLG